MGEELGRWAAELRPFMLGEPDIDEERSLVTFRLATAGLEIPSNPPADAVVVVDASEIPGPYLTVSMGPAVLRGLELLHIRESVTHLQFKLRNPEGLRAKINRASSGPRLNLYGDLPDCIGLDNGFYEISGEASSLPQWELHLQDTDLFVGREFGDLKLRKSVLAGSVKVAGVKLFSEKTHVLTPNLEISLRNESHLGYVTTTNAVRTSDSGLTIKSQHSFGVGSVPVGTTLVCSHLANLRLDDHYVDVAIRCGGYVTVEADSQLIRPAFEPVTHKLPNGMQSKTYPHLRLKANSEVRRAVGRVSSLGCASKTILTGNPDANPLAADVIQQVEGSELQNLDLYGIHPLDLDELAKCERVQPWIPRRRGVFGILRRHPARTKENAQLAALTTEDEDDVGLERRAHYWAKMVSVLKGSHASGLIQSEARYAATRSRRFLSKGAERWLLHAYWLVGYGERIARPLILFIILCAGLSWQFRGPWFPTFWKTLLSPLSFFRGVFPVVEVEGLFDLSLKAGLQVIGIICLFFSITAIRRIGKAE